MEKHHKLQKAISEILEPNLEDRLVFGCELIGKDDAKIRTIFELIDYTEYILYSRTSKDGSNRFSSDLDLEIILGLPINLERLLLALRQIDTKYSYKSKYDFISKKVSHKTFIGFNWKLDQIFTEQDIETQESIYKLFNIE
jgi:hypothetical protein